MSTIGGTSLGGNKQGSTLGGKPGTSLGNNQKPAGGTSLGGTAIGGNQKPAGGTSLGGTAIGGNQKIAASSGETNGTSLGENQNKPEQNKQEQNKPEQNKPEQIEKEDGPEGAKKGKKKKKKANVSDTPAEGEVQPQQPQPTKAKGKPPAKGAAAAAVRIKALQAEKERLKKEEEERKKQEEEEERLAKIQAEEAEKRKKEAADAARKANEDSKKKRQAEELQRRREEAMKKYGMDPSQFAAFSERGRGGARGKGRGKRGGRGAASIGDRDENSDNQEVKLEDSATQNAEDSSNQVNTEEVVDDWEALDETEKKEPEQVIDDWEQEAEEDQTIKASKEEPKPESEPEPNKEEVSEYLTNDEKQKDEKTENTPQLTEKQRRAAQKEEKKAEMQKQKEENLDKKLRSPIVCVLGHVDAGKTSLLDKMRSSNVQGGEAGGITQQIGATFFPMDNIKEATKRMNDLVKGKLNFKVPGLLIVDTPGHEAFTNLRSRGSSLCDIAILVVDMMHGLEPQTRESIGLLKKRKTPFVVALNKVDRLYSWNATPYAPLKETLKKQNQAVMAEYEQRVKHIITELAAEGLNAELYYKNKEYSKFVSLVPTSAATGEGIPDILALLIQLSQNLMTEKLLKLSKLQCTVLEVKKIPGHGTTLDVILANGILRRGDKFIVCGMTGEPIIATIKALLLPPAMKELRIKSDYEHHDTVRASIGCKIDAAGIDDAVAGSPLFVIDPKDTPEQIQEYEKQVCSSLNSLKEKIAKNGIGVYVQASTLGSLEALLEFLSDSHIPVSQVNLGPVHKKDILKASVVIEKKPEFGVILAFDVTITPEATEHAEKLGVKIFEADIIYKLFEMFTNYIKKFREDTMNKAKEIAIFPCQLQILPQHIFNSRHPIIVGVRVVSGIVKTGTPIIVYTKDNINLGKIVSIRDRDQKPLDEALTNQEVSIEIRQDEGKQQYHYGRQFDETDEFYSLITRDSLDALVEHFPEVCQEHFKLLKKLKTVNHVI